MTLYRAILNETLETAVDYCDCKHCKGHEREEKVIFNELIEAETKEDARDQAIKEIKELYSVNPEDLTGLVILEPGEKILTRKAELELLDRWINGRGLPDRPLETEYTYQTVRATL